MPDPTVYSIDTNVLMDWQARFYPTDVFPTLSDRLDALVSAGRWQAPAIPCFNFLRFMRRERWNF